MSSINAISPEKLVRLIGGLVISMYLPIFQLGSVME